jgi:N-acyl homoserine lactone hydrolase
MKVHAIQTGRVQIKQSQIEGQGHGVWRRAQPFVSSEWADWSPTYAWAIEHSEGVIVVDTGEAAHLKSLPRWHPYFQVAVRFEIEPEQEVGPQSHCSATYRADGRPGPRRVRTRVVPAPRRGFYVGAFTLG